MLRHNCAAGSMDILISKEDNIISIKRNIESSFSDVLIPNITFCPFCGMNLRDAK